MKDIFSNHLLEQYYPTLLCLSFFYSFDKVKCSFLIIQFYDKQKTPSLHVRTLYIIFSILFRRQHLKNLTRIV